MGSTANTTDNIFNVQWSRVYCGWIIIAHNCKFPCAYPYQYFMADLTLVEDGEIKSGSLYHTVLHTCVDLTHTAEELSPTKQPDENTMS